MTPIDRVKLFFKGIQDVAFLGWSACSGLFRRPWYGKETIEQMDLLGVGSVGIVVLTGLFAGMALAMQFSIELSPFGAKGFLGRAVTVSILRELGPVLTGLMVAGRVGSGVSAELGAMKVTQQIDAIQVLGSDPVKKLVVPRIVAVVVMLPILTLISDLMGIGGGYSVAVFLSGMSSPAYWAGVGQGISFENVVGGMAKPFVFGLIIALIGCYQGLGTTGGTKGIGKATTQAVVVASILILIANFLVTKLLVELFGWET